MSCRAVDNVGKVSMCDHAPTSEKKEKDATASVKHLVRAARRFPFRDAGTVAESYRMALNVESPSSFPFDVHRCSKRLEGQFIFFNQLVWKV